MSEPTLTSSRLPGSWEDLAVAACDCMSEECRSCRGIAKFMPRIVAETLDAFLASPQAAEELARALLSAEVGCLSWGGFHDGNNPERHHAKDAANVLSAWRKARHREEP